MKARFIDSIHHIDRDEWNAITGTDHPFTRHEFFAAMEDSGATNRRSGWQPNHLVVRDNDQLAAVMPLYLKYHSYGEYVFDWSWADAFQRNGLDYYPKLLSAIPFTPSTGPRLCIDADCDNKVVTRFALNSLIEHVEKQQLSSIHILFPQEPLRQSCELQNLSSRLGTQFHWFNRGYQTFDDFLATFSSRKRKNLKKERRRLHDSDLRIEVLEGPQIAPELWQRFYYFYQLTYAKRSGHGGYLEQAFFEQVAKTMPENIVLVLAYIEGEPEPIAGALNFRDSETLYGRYWGCIAEYDFLHFEACYYQGIEYCIEKGLKKFDAGAQGEHKIQRGFEPVETWSNHWIYRPEFNAAIGDFLKRDEEHTRAYIKQAGEMLPFQKNS